MGNVKKAKAKKKVVPSSSATCEGDEKSFISHNNQTNKEQVLNFDSSTPNAVAVIEENYSIEKLMEQVESLLSQFNYELAEKFCSRAFEYNNNDADIAETLGYINMELGNMEKACELWKKAIVLSPNIGHAKFMYLGQAKTGQDALTYFKQGVQVMLNQIAESKQGAANFNLEEFGKYVTMQDVSTAYCSIAEIYMTDKCFSDDAESECFKNLQLALESDSKNPTVYYMLGNFWLSKNDQKLAKEFLKKGIDLWMPEDDNDQVDKELEVELPAYSERVNVCKLLIEVEEYDLSFKILESLLEENDEIVEVWYLLAWLHYVQGDEHLKAAGHYLQKASEVNVIVPCSDQDINDHVAEMSVELSGRLLKTETKENVEAMEM